MKKFVFSCFLYMLFASHGLSQGVLPVISEAIIDENGDTLAIITLPEFVKFAPPEFKNNAEQRRFDRLVRNVKVAYPYSRLAGIRMREYETLLAQTNTEWEKKALMRKAEDNIRKEFEADLMKLTFTQGWILLKLIDRETGSTSYDIVSEFRGKFRAFFWQSLARVFGFDLKVRYDPEGADKDIELIVRMIEAGAI